MTPEEILSIPHRDYVKFQLETPETQQIQEFLLSIPHRDYVKFQLRESESQDI